MFNFGRGVGIWIGIIATLGLRVYTPTPAKWRKEMLMGIPVQDDKKAMSIQAATRLFPSINLTPGRKRKPDDGLAEAALLAEFARRMDR